MNLKPTYFALPYSKGVCFCLDRCPEEVGSFLLRLSESWITEGEVLKNGSRSLVLRVDIGGVFYILKIYNKRALHRRLRYAISYSRAFQSWKSGHQMAKAGIPVACPLAILEERKFFIPGRAILLMPVAQGDDLLSLVKDDKLSETQLGRIADKLTSLFQKMKSSSMTHGDMKATNILIDDKCEPSLIDMDGGVLHVSDKSFQVSREKEKARFMKNWESYPAAKEAFRNVFGEG